MPLKKVIEVAQQVIELKESNFHSIIHIVCERRFMPLKNKALRCLNKPSSRLNEKDNKIKDTIENCEELVKY